MGLVDTRRADLGGLLLGSQLTRMNRLLWIDGAGVVGRNLFPQLDDFALHLGVAAALADSLEVGFNFAVEFQSTTSGTVGPGVLSHIASKL